MFHTKVFNLDQNTEQENAYLYMALLLFLAFSDFSLHFIDYTYIFVIFCFTN